MDKVYSIIGSAEELGKKYLPIYFNWLEEKLASTEPFAVLSGAIIVVFVLVVYLWFRNREL